MPQAHLDFLHHSFHQEEFINFCRYHFLTPKFTYEVAEVPITGLDSIVDCTYIGGDSDLNLSVFIIKHNASKDPRVTLTREIHKLMKLYRLPNALVALYSDNSNQWRLSLVTSEYTDRLKKEFSSPKRFSYLVGEGAKVKTPEKQLAKKVETINELKQRFSLEVLTNEFYNTLQNSKGEGLYKDLYSNITLPSVSQESNKPKDFAIRLIGRLLFCWFLKEKGWIDRTLLSSGEIKRLNSEGKNYYHEILEKLFFETLNKPKEQRDATIDALFERTPYLNGGLFDPQSDDFYKKEEQNIADRYQANLRVSNDALFALFELFELYNFTIDENTSSNQEIGVDPEMMGRVFENFILNRSSTGSFYTPREIVDYMVESTLKEFLKSETGFEAHIDNLFQPEYWAPNDKFFHDIAPQIMNKLSTIKVIDPACGSGAFPMGVLQKMVELFHILGDTRTDYDIKKDILSSSIYGVDLLPIAVEISRLRCWLSLVVDEENDNPIPLPNLEFKFVCANSLIGIDQDIFTVRTIDDIYGENDGIETTFNKIDAIRQASFQPAVDKHDFQTKWKHESQVLLRLAFDTCNSKMIQEATKIANWDPFNTTLANFFDPQWMFGVKEFDIVISNPPYVGEKGNKETFEPLKKSELGRKFYQGKMDLFYFFFHLGLDVLKPKGLLSFITTNYYITATAGVKLRKDFQDRSNVLKLINFGELKIFESALGQHNMITILQKKKTSEKDGVFAKTVITHNKGYLGNNVLLNIIDGKDENTNYYNIPQSQLYDDNGYIKLTSGPIDEVLDRMLVGCVSLGEICDVNTGLFTAADKIFILDKEGKEIFEKQLNILEKSLLKPIFKNSDIQKYNCSLDANKFVIYHYEKSRYSLDDIPFIFKYLEENQEKLKNRKDNSLKGALRRGRWDVMALPKTAIDFESPKIVAPQRSKTNTFGYNETAWYASADVYFITQPKDGYQLKFLLGVLNSKAIYKWLYYRGKRKGKMLELYQKPLSEIPIPTLDTPEKQGVAGKIEALVDQILTVKAEDGEADIARQEEQIDELVFELYGLNDEERSIILAQ